MEKKKYLKRYWNKILMITGIMCFLVACMYVDKKPQNGFVGNNNEPYKVISVKYRDSIYRMVLRNNDVILERTAIVTPQSRIDSIYKGKVDILLSHFFDDSGFIALELSYDEEKYLIDILYRNKILVNVACESGYLYIDN